MRFARCLFLPLGAVVLATGAGCSGWHWGAESTQARTGTAALPKVAVLPFDNQSFRRGLEMRLTRLVDDELRARSPGSPAPEAEADWVLRGDIIRADERIISEGKDDTVREATFVVSVRITIEERATQKVLGTYSLTEQEPFSSRAGRIRNLEQASEQVLRDLAEQIVYRLEARSPEPTS